MIRNLNFQYNKKDAICNFCYRKRNPHPDFDEPIIVREIEIKSKNLFICINCHFDLLDKANGNENIFNNFLKEKYNLIKLLQKVNILKNFNNGK